MSKRLRIGVVAATVALLASGATVLPVGAALAQGQQGTAAAQQRALVDQLVLRGKEALARRDYGTAETAFRAALAEQRKSGVSAAQGVDILEGLGDVHAGKGETDAAQQAYGQALALAQEAGPALSNRQVGVTQKLAALRGGQALPGPAIFADEPGQAGAVLHRQSGARFPQKLAGWRRERTVVNKRDGSDVSVIYVPWEGGGSQVAVIVYENAATNPQVEVDGTFSTLAGLRGIAGTPKAGRAAAATEDGTVWRGWSGVLCDLKDREGKRWCESVHAYQLGAQVVKFRGTLQLKNTDAVNRLIAAMTRELGWPRGR